MDRYIGRPLPSNALIRYGRAPAEVKTADIAAREVVRDAHLVHNARAALAQPRQSLQRLPTVAGATSLPANLCRMSTS